MRHAQLWTSAEFASMTVAVATPEASSMPAVAPMLAMLPASPRRLSGAVSTRYATEPVNSPPTEKPCSKRMKSKSIGAPMPIA